MKSNNDTNKYSFKPYNGIFPELFTKEKKRIEKAIGCESRVEHIGSTAVPGLGGKGVIDIYIVTSADEMKNVSRKIQSLGYQFKTNAGSKLRLFHEMDLPDPIDGQRRYHVHIVPKGSLDFACAISFRDYLITHPEAAIKYAEAKKEASRMAGPNGEGYVATKMKRILPIKRSVFYEIVKRIPKGKVATYGQLSRMADLRNPRYAGYLLSKNDDPEHVPCHRVINSKGEIAGNYAFGGLDLKAHKLREEGIKIINNKIDLSVYQWDGR